MDIMADRLYQEAPASPVIAMVTWTFPYLAAVTQSQADASTAAKVMAAWLATVALKDSLETPSRQKTASVSKQQTSKESKETLACT